MTEPMWCVDRNSPRCSPISRAAATTSSGRQATIPVGGPYNRPAQPESPRGGSLGGIPFRCACLAASDGLAWARRPPMSLYTEGRNLSRGNRPNCANQLKSDRRDDDVPGNVAHSYICQGHCEECQMTRN